MGKKKPAAQLLEQFNVDKHVGKILHYKGFKFIVRKEKNKKDEDIYVATTPHYNNGASGIAGTVTGSPVVTAYRMIKLLQNTFLSIQVMPKIGDTYHNFDESKEIRTIIDVIHDKAKNKFICKTRKRTKEMHAQIMVNNRSGAAAISLALVNEPDAQIEEFVCDDFANLEDSAENIFVDGRKHQWDLFIWKGIDNAKQVQSPKGKKKSNALRVVSNSSTKDTASTTA